MLFKDFVLEVRKRLQDMRKADGTLITVATEDGIRWSSDVLTSVCSGQLMECLRTFSAMKLRPWINEAAQYQNISSGAKITAGTGVINVGTIVFSKILNIQEKATPTRIYEFIEQELFFDMRYKTQDIDGAYYSYFYDTNVNKVQAQVLPPPAMDIDIAIVVKVPLDSIYTLDSTIVLPFIDITDLLIDYAEMEARRIEGNTGAAKDLQAIIDFKLKELASELSGT